MKHKFDAGKYFTVPDGTLVCPFMNCKDIKSGLPFDLFDDFSIAAGRLKPHMHSKIHIMPFVTQVTFVRKGKLDIRMKSLGDEAPYSIVLSENEAALTEPETFIQLRNDEKEVTEVLYIVSPAYLFMMDNVKIVYDDSVVLNESWEELAKLNWKPANPFPTLADRLDAQQQLTLRAC
jgi:hypothetical protein